MSVGIQYNKRSCPKGKHNCSEIERWAESRQIKLLRNPHPHAILDLNLFGTKIAFNQQTVSKI